jgi:hypothetical protein
MRAFTAFQQADKEFVGAVVEQMRRKSGHAARSRRRWQMSAAKLTPGDPQP